MYPKAMVPFDATGVPRRIFDSFTEAIISHAHGCYTACAIMVRKTVEELCDEMGADPGTLVVRLKSLKDRAIVPDDVYDALNEMRVFGNDAAHIELRNYNNIGPEECDIAMKIATFLIDTMFRTKSLTDALRSRRKQSGGTGP